MKLPFTRVLFAVCITALASCDLDRPFADTGTPSMSAAPFGTPPELADAVAALPQQYLMMFKGRSISSKLAAAIADAGGTIVFQHTTGVAVVEGLEDAGLGDLAGHKDVIDLQIDATFALDDEIGGTAAADIASPSDPSTAFFYPRQWNLRAVSADAAWAAGRLGSAGVTVAILDTGIDYLHVDLAGRVDLSRSASFVPGDDLFAAVFFPTRHVITDLNFHGTHVAATVSSNALAAAGVTSGVTLIGAKVCSVFGTCSFASVVQGLLHAVDNGADVVNMSLGGGFLKSGNGRFVGFINSLFNYARSSGVTVVVAAGNDAADLDHNGNVYATYCDTPATVCVSATGPTASAGTNGPWTNVDAPANYTNFGRSSINVAAPGGTGAGRVWAACSTSSLLIPICQSGTFVLGVTGTSMATPHVAGLAALLVEDRGRKPGQIKTRIQNGADDLGQPGTDPFYGKGRINFPGSVN